MLEFAPKDAVFHFNKKFLEDQTIPMWVLKFSGQTYYVNHVACTVPWSTKETPDNPSTKGSIKIKNPLIQIDDENCARISTLTEHDKVRLRNTEKGISRIIIKNVAKLREVLAKYEVKHSTIKTITGSCSSTLYMCDILVPSHMTVVSLALANSDSFRVLQPNESYYKMYDNPKYKESDVIDTDWYFDEEDEEDDD